MATLIKIDRNGSKHWEGMVTCDRCGGKGYYAIGICNGLPVLSPLDSGICYKCHGAGKVLGKWIERTPEYQAKLDARREAKAKAKQEQWERENAERIEAERAAREAEKARIKAEKAVSQYVGEVGEKIAVSAVYDHLAWYEVDSFRGYGKDTVYIHTFRDDAGNVLVWKTSKGTGLEKGDRAEITGTVKEHGEYKGEKQTVLTRCKVKKGEAV